MCEFITAILPQNIDKKAAQAVFLTYGRGFELIDNYRIAEYIDKTDLYILTTNGACDCGTSLGNFDEDEPLSMDEEKLKRYEDDQLKKLKAKGWSENKIRRKLEQETASRKEKELEKSNRVDDDIIRWTDLIRELLTSKTTGRVGLLIHSYSSGVENKRLPQLGQKTIKLDKLTTNVLLETRQDVIYQFVT